MFPPVDIVKPPDAQTSNCHGQNFLCFAVGSSPVVLMADPACRWFILFVMCDIIETKELGARLSLFVWSKSLCNQFNQVFKTQTTTIVQSV